MIKFIKTHALVGGTKQSAKRPFFIKKQNLTINTNKRAFSLSETLITIAIIGIIAALTVPTLLTQYKKHIWVTKLRQTYAQLNTDMRLAVYKTGCADIACLGTKVGAMTNNTKILDELVSNMMDGKPLYRLVSFDTRLPKAKKIDGVETTLGMLPFPYAGTQYTFYKLEDGKWFGCWEWGMGFYGDCAGNNNCTYCIFTTENKNFEQGRNVFFVALLGNGGLAPAAQYEGAEKGLCQFPNPSFGGRAGDSCFSRIMKNGWKMDY